MKSSGLHEKIPPELCGLTNLTHLRLHHNQLSGSIPPEIGDLMSLTNLSFENNGLTGAIPETILNPDNLNNGGLNICGNFLYTDRDEIRNFLNEKQLGGDWESCQKN